MSLKDAFSIAASGLTAQRVRMESIASNLANARTTRTPEGGPYKRRDPVFVAEPTAPAATPAAGDPFAPSMRGVRVERIAEDPSAPVMKYEPGHPDADAAGFVAYPNVDSVQEMVNLLSASRSYEANVTMVRGLREMSRQALGILR